MLTSKNSVWVLGYLGILWPHQQSILQKVSLFYRKVSDLSSDSDFEYNDSPFYDRSPIYIPSDEEEVKHKETSRCRDITSGSGPSGTWQTSSHVC